MKGLLLKDWYILRNKGKMYFVIIPVYTAIALYQRNGFFLYFCAVFAAMIPRTFASYDEHAHWSSYTAALPLSKAQVVLARYIAAVLTLLFTMAVTAVIQIVGSAAHGALPEALPVQLAVMAVLFSVYTAVSMPCIYRFGMEKGRIIQMVLMVAFMMAAGTVAALAEEETAAALLSTAPGAVAAAGILLSAVFLVASYFFSVKLYRYTPNL